MHKKILLFVWVTLCFVVVANAANDKFTLVIDAGHGGNDAGAIGKISKEKNINLKVALAFGQLVERNCPDVKVIYTRKTDVFIPLHERANIANRNKADLFISIHTNALPKGRIARGLETYTLGMNRAADNFEVAKRENSVILIEKDYKQHYEGFDPNSSESYIMFEFLQDKNMGQSVELAKAVQKRTCAAAGRPDKGVKQAGFLVLRETSMPSCLIELGFITTPDEEQYLNSQSGVEALGRGIYQAFLDYKKKHPKSSSTKSRATARQNVSNDSGEQRAQTARATQTAQPTPTVKATPAVPPTPETAVTKRTAATPKVPVEATVKKESKREKRNSKSIIKELEDARNGIITTDADDDSNQTATARFQEMAVADTQRQEETPQHAASPRETSRQETRDAPAEKPQETRVVMPADGQPTGTGTNTAEAKAETATAEPVFKVQIMACDVDLKAGDRQFKGLTDVDSYYENGFYKYTVGASTDYNGIYQLRKNVLSKFPEAFIIAFKDGRKMNVTDAIREFKTNRNKTR